MTIEEYKAVFTRYGRQETYITHDIGIFAHSPAAINKTADIIREDKIISDDIAKLQKEIEFLNFHRQQLAKRYGELETMAYTRKLTLKREHRAYSGIHYYITIDRIMEDGTTVSELSETYPGKERHKAIARFEELKKKNPGIKTEKDIAKSRWER